MTDISSHRGGALLWPENSRIAFENTAKLPVEQVEFDVHPTRDGRLVVIHDDTLDRTTSGRGPVGAQTLAQLKRLDAGYAAQFGQQFAGEPLPTLAEVFATYGQRTFVNVELKFDRSPRRVLAEKVLNTRTSCGS